MMAQGGRGVVAARPGRGAGLGLIAGSSPPPRAHGGALAARPGMPLPNRRRTASIRNSRFAMGAVSSGLWAGLGARRARKGEREREGGGGGECGGFEWRERGRAAGCQR